ncbi:MAG TPA: ABC transporter ATP-binding protein [Hyphomicrobiales bacterium]|nr:ABC transporter ATP-binding protein [Hyphomicrobiales bacterium]
MTAALETSHLVKRFGGLAAVNDVSFRLEKGARQALIGPNGSGKTTFINLLTGALPPTSGSVVLESRDVTALAPDRRARLGLARTFQISQLFLSLTPLEALALAAYERQGLGGRAFLTLAGARHIASEVAEIADQFALTDVLDQAVSTLPYGKQRLLEIALAFASRPRVLLLDEPAAGIPESERQDILAAIARLPADVSILLIEHDMDLVFRFASRISVFSAGSLLTEGSVEEVSRDPRVRAIYLGEELHV